MDLVNGNEKEGRERGRQWVEPVSDWQGVGAMAIEMQRVMRKEKIKRGTAAYPQKEGRLCVRMRCCMLARVFFVVVVDHAGQALHRGNKGPV